MEAPEELALFGARYVRADLIESLTPEPIERWYSVAELVDMSGFSASSIYRAMRQGRLAYKCPNGSSVGRRVSRREWTRFLEAS